MKFTTSKQHPARPGGYEGRRSFIMKKIIIAVLAASVGMLILALISCAACASVRAADTAAELDALRAENARLSAELEAVRSDNTALTYEAEAQAAETARLAAVAVDNYYTRTGLVVDLDYDTDVVTVVDGADLVWQFTGCEDYCIGDLVEMLMQKTGKPDYILDDVIFSICYAGFCAEYFQD